MTLSFCNVATFDIVFFAYSIINQSSRVTFFVIIRMCLRTFHLLVISRITTAWTTCIAWCSCFSNMLKQLIKHKLSTLQKYIHIVIYYLLLLQLLLMHLQLLLLLLCFTITVIFIIYIIVHICSRAILTIDINIIIFTAYYIVHV